MERIRDFTLLPVGAELFGGTVEECPFCRRRGLHERVNGVDFYVQTETVGIENGTPIMSWEHCFEPQSA
jgi:hypothetical protein